MRKYDYYWQSNPDWYYYKDGQPVLRDNAPTEAKESYERFLEQLKESLKKR